MIIYIAGVMQGSTKGHGIQGQSYRQTIRDAVISRYPDTEFFDPYLKFPNSVEFDDKRAKEALFEMAGEAGSSDMVIAYLPEASMGTALEMIRAYDNGKTIISISPMEKNWLIRAVSTKIFASVDDFCSWVQNADLEELIRSPKE